MTAPAERRIALVTGASRGIGAAAAVELGRRGLHVVLVARTPGGLEETDDAIRAAGGSATLLPLDLTQGAQLDMLGPSLLERFGRLDVLVGCAGILGKLTPVAHITDRDFSRTVAINVEAGLRLIRTTSPLLVAGPAGRAVFVTARAARQPRAYWGLYGATKAALEHLVLCWAEETERTPLRVNLFDPGAVATRLRRAAMPGEDASRLPKPEDVAPLLAACCAEAETRHGEVVRRETVSA